MPTLLLESEYTPIDLFEERAELRSGAYLFVIDSGRAEASIPVDDETVDYRPLSIELHERLDNLFLAAQVLSHQAYSLAGPRTTKSHPRW